MCFCFVHQRAVGAAQMTLLAEQEAASADSAMVEDYDRAAAPALRHHWLVITLTFLSAYLFCIS